MNGNIAHDIGYCIPYIAIAGAVVAGLVIRFKRKP
jgi:hypothetical protein